MRDHDLPRPETILFEQPTQTDRRTDRQVLLYNTRLDQTRQPNEGRSESINLIECTYTDVHIRQINHTYIEEDKLTGIPTWVFSRENMVML